MGAKEYKLFSVIKPNRIFDNIPETDLSFKISQKDFVNFEEGDIIFQTGDQAETIYLIIEGRVKIKHNASVDGQRYFEKSDHEFFGEREFIQGGVRSSSAVAETPIKAFVLSKEIVNQLIEKNSALLHNLQAIDPMKDVARFGMTTQYHSDEFDALMRSVRQSAGSDPYSTTESLGIIPDSAKTESAGSPNEEEVEDETVQISGQPEENPSTFNPHFTMEILDPSEDSSYTVTDNTFSTNDDFFLPPQGLDSDDTFAINPDLFKTNVESSFVFPGSETADTAEEQTTPFDFDALNALSDNGLPLPENNFYNDIYGDQPTGNEPEVPTEGFSFPFDLSELPDDDGIKKEGSLDEYLAEHPEEADMITGTGEPSSELNDVQQLFSQEGFKLPEGFAQSLLDSDLLNKSPEELEQLIRSGAKSMTQEIPVSNDEHPEDFSPEIIPPDTVAQDEQSESELPPEISFLDLDRITFDAEPQPPISDEAAPDLTRSVNPDLAGFTEPPDEDNLPADEETNAELTEAIYTAEPPFHLSLPGEESPDAPPSPTADSEEEELPDSEEEEQPALDGTIQPGSVPFHLSLPGDDERRFDAIADEHTDAAPGIDENIYKNNNNFSSTEETGDPFAPFQVRITGEHSAPEPAAEPLPPETDHFSNPDDETADDDISPVQHETNELTGWDFEETADELSPPENTTVPEVDTTSSDDTESFEAWEPQNDDALSQEHYNEPPMPQRGALLNTLFGKSAQEKNEHHEPQHEDEQSGEYIWNFERNEFVKLQPGKIADAIPEKGEDELKKDFTKTLADEPLPPQRSTALTGEFVTSDFVWDTVTEEFVSISDAPAAQSEEEDPSEPAQPDDDIYNFTSPATTGEVVTSDFVWDAEKEVFISASGFETVSSREVEAEPVSGTKEPSSEDTPFSFGSFGEEQPGEDDALPPGAQDNVFKGFSSTDEEDIYQLPKDYASGDFNLAGDISPEAADDKQHSQQDARFADQAAEDAEPESEGGLWDFSDEEELPLPDKPQLPDQSNELPQNELKLPTLNFLDDAHSSGDISEPGQLPPDAMDQVKNWIDKASDHDLMNLLSNMGKAFETIERPPAEKNSAAEPADIYNDNEDTVRDNMDNTSNPDNKKSLRSLFKVVSEKPQPSASSEPENVFDATDAFWGSPDDSSERESFLEEDSHNMNELSDASDQNGGSELGSVFTAPDAPAAFVKKNEPDFNTPLKKTAALDSMQMSSDREAGLSVEQLRMIIEAAKTVNSNVKLDEALTTIVVTASNLTKADRGTLYIIDRETDELWSKVMKGGVIEEIRLKIGQGISGWVARSGEIVNLKNAYEDPRFDSSFDGITGYKTTSMLCYPIKDKHNNVIAVMQLLNSQQGNFTKLDEEMISALSSFIGITIQNAELIDGLVHGDRLNSLGKVANFIISDIKKPILTIKHLAEHLRTKKDLPRDVRSVLKMILDQSIIVGDLILTTLNYSQGKVILNKKLVKINSVLDEILGMLQDAVEYKKVQIFKKYDRDVLVMVDRKELYQAFFQITKNACDAMPGGGKLQVTTKVIDDDGTIEISFKDSGMGIPDSIKEKLFDPFFSQGKKNGIGLGLPITEKIIREHGGTISVESVLGDGADFVITIPLVTKVG
ncbi:MAG: cyclic nucleotide-binding domain-containing protein [Ignavibacteriaceae bacterium]|nr:cyclic nucleotide-binding domain-containing protein [Ignavibacteriaceae bacterium]